MDYEMNEKYASMAFAVMHAVPELRWIYQSGISIGFMSCFKPKKSGKKAVLGECVKVADLYGPFCPFDFLIVIYEQNIIGLTENQLKVLLWHELKHVGWNFDKDHAEIVPHDIEDFYSIIDRFGSRWSDPGFFLPDITAEGGG